MKRVFAYIGFSFAITLIILNFLKIEAAFAILAIAGAVFAVSIIIKRTRQSLSVPLCAMCAFLACAIFISNYYFVFLPQENLDNKTIETEFYIVDLEEKKNDKFYYTVKTDFVDADNSPQTIRLTIRSSEKINADYYQKIKGKVKLYLTAENAFSSYGNYANHIFLSGSLIDFEVLDEHVINANKIILNLRQSIKNIINHNIESPESSIIIGILIGDKSEISSEISENFRYSGVSHIMAVSGLHLSVFCGFITFLLRKTRISKSIQPILCIFCTLFYMSMAGFSKSIIRAGIMMIIMLAGKLFKQKADSLNSLGFAVFLICLNPYSVTDAGALLTVTAVFGLIVINPLIKRVYKPVTKLFSYFYNVICASVSVFIATLPVVCFTFGYVSVLGIILNMVMIPLAQITLVSSLTFVVFSWFKPLVFIISKVCEFFASLIIFITDKTADIPYAIIDVSDHKCVLAIGIVIIIFGIAVIFNNKTVLKSAIAISLIAFVSVISVSEIISFNYVYVKEIQGYYSTAAVIYNKKNAVVVGVDDSSQYYAVSNMLKSKNLDVSMIIDINKSNYSQKLAEKFGTLNFVSQSENIKYFENCKNYFTDDYFDVDLWQSLNVKYIINKENQYVSFNIYGMNFIYAKKLSVDFGKNYVCINDDSDYDIVYTISKNGFSERKFNEWQK